MTSLESAEPATAAPRLRVPVGVIVAIACAAQFVLVMNTTIVNVALPGIHQAFGLSVDGQQWVINGYLVTFGGFLLLAARAGDLFGQKKVFQAGLVIFTLASLAGGLAQDSGWLLAARFVQGLGAAAMTPSTISLIITSPMESHHRTRALGLWSAAASIGGAAGLVLGGVLTSALGWRYVLLVNVPLGAALLLVASVSLLPSTAGSDWRRLDIPGAVTATLGVLALVYGLSDASAGGWSSALVIAALAAAVLLLAAFGVIETRTAAPLVPLGIFRHRPLSIANVLFASLGVTLTAVVYFLSLYEEQVLGYSAIRTGLSLVPMTVMTAIGAIASQKMVRIFGPRTLLVVGGVVAAAGLAWLSRIPVHSDYATCVLGPTLVAGAGMSLMFVPIVAAATIGIDRQHAGLASGLVNMSRQVGGAIGLAILVTVAASGAHRSGLSAAVGVVHGYRTVFAITAAVSLASVVVAALLPAKPKPVPVPPAPSRPPADAAAPARGHAATRLHPPHSERTFTMTTSPPAQPTARASTGKRLQIDAWGDLNCPWCYIGKNRLDQAIASSPHAKAITVKVRSFELDPHMPQEAKPNLELLAAKYGVPPAEAMRMENKVAAIAHRDGLPFSLDRVVANSFDVHRVLHLADTTGLADQLLGDLQRTLFSGRANVYDHTVLADIASRLGIPRSRVEAVLSSDEYADAVRADETQARELGVTGVPFTVFDGRIAIPGSTGTEGYANAINRAWSSQ